MQTRLNYIFCKRYIYFPVHTLLQISSALPPKETPYHWKKHHWCGLIEFENITYYMHTYYTQRYFSNEKLCCTLTLEGGGEKKNLIHTSMSVPCNVRDITSKQELSVNDHLFIFFPLRLWQQQYGSLKLLVNEVLKNRIGTRDVG